VVLGTDRGVKTLKRRRNPMKKWLAVLGAALILTALPAMAQVLNPYTVDALQKALDDERANEAQYAAVLTVYGTVSPFSQIVLAEQKHQAAILQVMRKYGIPARPTELPEMTVPDTLAACCAAGAQSERDNIAMYSTFLASPFVTQRDIRNVFTNLRSASLNQHLPAFLNCNCTPGTGTGPGSGRRR
jgi:hypothetical protein